MKIERTREVIERTYALTDHTNEAKVSYSRILFRPDTATVTVTDGVVAKIHLAGPRVLSDGTPSRKSRNGEWYTKQRNGEWTHADVLLPAWVAKWLKQEGYEL